MDMNIVREIVTVVSLFAFCGIIAWTVSRKNRERFEEAARLVLDDETLTPMTLTPTLSQGRGSERGTGFREIGAPRR
jgi:cytochrome c oxidase cbb3-type subunit 4